MLNIILLQAIHVLIHVIIARCLYTKCGWSMDYTPVTFTIRKENPRTTTYCHELALAYVFESGWICMADRPEAYLKSPARPILEK